MKKTMIAMLSMVAVVSFAAPQILKDNQELAAKVNAQAAASLWATPEGWAAYQNSKPMLVKNAENRLLNWFRTRVPGMENATRFTAPTGRYSVIAAMTVAQALAPIYDGGDTNKWNIESGIVQDCRTVLVNARQYVNSQLEEALLPKFFMDESEEAALAECAWHEDADWQRDGDLQAALSSVKPMKKKTK